MTGLLRYGIATAPLTPPDPQLIGKRYDRRTDKVEVIVGEPPDIAAKVTQYAVDGGFSGASTRVD